MIKNEKSIMCAVVGKFHGENKAEDMLTRNDKVWKIVLLFKMMENLIYFCCNGHIWVKTYSSKQSMTNRWGQSVWFNSMGWTKP